MLIVVGYSWWQSKRTPAVQVRAVVARKRFMSTPLTRYVTFRIAGDGDLELIVPESVFFSADEGQWGSLVYQGEIFRSFIPEPKVVDQPPPPPSRPLQPLNPDYDEHKTL